jgi:hypothetical protein
LKAIESPALGEAIDAIAERWLDACGAPASPAQGRSPQEIRATFVGAGLSNRSLVDTYQALAVGTLELSNASAPFARRITCALAHELGNLLELDSVTSSPSASATALMSDCFAEGGAPPYPGPPYPCGPPA